MNIDLNDIKLTAFQFGRIITIGKMYKRIQAFLMGHFRRARYFLLKFPFSVNFPKSLVFKDSYLWTELEYLNEIFGSYSSKGID